MRTRILITSTLAIVGSFGINPAHAGFPFNPPQFVGTPYAVTVNVGPPGPHGFTFSGSAVDVDTEDTVTISIVGIPQEFIRFETTPGNPAYFTVTGFGLTRDNLGPNRIALYASDGTPFGAGTSLLINVVLPEPMTALSVGMVHVFASRRRRRR